MLQNRCVWTTAVLPAWHGPVLCTHCCKGRVCSLGTLWSGRFNDSLEQMQCIKSMWGQILRELRLVTGVISFQLCSNCSLLLGQELEHPQLRVGGGCYPEEQCYSNPCWNSTSFSLGHCLKHHCRRASIALSMATSLFPTLQEFIKGQSKKEAVDFCWTWGNVW